MCDVFISRVPRSSRVSRDFEKILSRFTGLAVSSDFGTGWNGSDALGNTDGDTASLDLAVDLFMIGFPFRSL